MATSESDMRSLIKDFITLGRTVEWLRSKDFPESEIQKVLEEEKAKQQLEREAKERLEVDAKARAALEAKARADFEAKMRTDMEARLRAEIEAQFRAEAETKAKLEAQAREKAEADKKLTKDTGSGYLGWLKGISVVKNYFGDTNTESPPISPDVPKSPTKLSAFKQFKATHKHSSRKSSTNEVMLASWEKTYFLKHAQAMIAVCKLLKEESKVSSEKLQTLEAIFEQTKYDSYESTISILLKVLSNEDELGDFTHIEPSSQEMLQQLNILIQFFTTAKIEAVIEAISNDINSNVSSINSSPSHSPVFSPSVESLESLKIKDLGGSVPASPALTPAAFGGMIYVNNVSSFQRLLEIIVEQKLTCPAPDNVSSIIASMKSKARKFQL